MFWSESVFVWHVIEVVRISWLLVMECKRTDWRAVDAVFQHRIRTLTPKDPFCSWTRSKDVGEIDIRDGELLFVGFKVTLTRFATVANMYAGRKRRKPVQKRWVTDSSVARCHSSNMPASHWTVCNTGFITILMSNIIVSTLYTFLKNWHVFIIGYGSLFYRHCVVHLSSFCNLFSVPHDFV